jgi:hypothetical protein
VSKYRAGGKLFATLEAAKAFAEAEFQKSGVVLGVEAVKRLSKAEKLAANFTAIRIQRAVYGFQIPMLSIPKLYTALEAATDAGKTDEELKSIVAGYPGVKESV